MCGEFLCATTAADIVFDDEIQGVTREMRVEVYPIQTMSRGDDPRQDRPVDERREGGAR